MKISEIILFALILLFISDPSLGNIQSVDEVKSKWGNDSIKCLENVSVYREYFKQHNYKESYKSWKYVYENCPAARKQTFIDGVKVIEYQISIAKDNLKKEAYIDSLYMVFDTRIKYFKEKGFVLGRKGISMLKYRPVDYENTYQTFAKSVELQQNESEYIVLHPYFYLSTKMFENNKITKENLIILFHELTKIIDYNIAKNNTPEKYEEARDKILTELKNSGVVDSCPAAVDIFKTRYQSDPENRALWKQIAGFLLSVQCLNTDLYRDVAIKIHKNEPSAESASLLAKLFISEEKYDEAFTYYEEAINLEQDTEKKALVLMELAKLNFGQSNNYSKARSYALKAAEIKPNWGDPYLLIGDLYAASGKLCGTGTGFDSQRIIWPAIDMWQKAKNVDSSASGEANKKISNYAQYLPEKADLFMRSLNPGDKYMVPCWINQETTVRSMEDFK